MRQQPISVNALTWTCEKMWVFSDTRYSHIKKDTQHTISEGITQRVALRMLKVEHKSPWNLHWCDVTYYADKFIKRSHRIHELNGKSKSFQLNAFLSPTIINYFIQSDFIGRKFFQTLSYKSWKSQNGVRSRKYARMDWYWIISLKICESKHFIYSSRHIGNSKLLLTFNFCFQLKEIRILSKLLIFHHWTYLAPVLHLKNVDHVFKTVRCFQAVVWLWKNDFFIRNCILNT